NITTGSTDPPLPAMWRRALKRAGIACDTATARPSRASASPAARIPTLLSALIGPPALAWGASPGRCGACGPYGGPRAVPRYVLDIPRFSISDSSFTSPPTDDEGSSVPTPTGYADRESATILRNPEIGRGQLPDGGRRAGVGQASIMPLRMA